MSEDKKYNGWTNYETWNVALWLDNDEYECNEHMPELARDAYLQADATSYNTREQSARYALAQTIKDYIEDMNPLVDQASMFSDLMGAALSEVNWNEIAEHYIDELDKSEFEDEALETEE